MNEISLNGVVEVHVHAKPDLYPRSYSDMELMEAGVQVQARAIVVKWHYGPTASRALLCNEMRRRLYPDASVEMYGSIVLNKPVGGINPFAVETSLKLGARIVWMPTMDSRNERHLKGFSDGIVCVEDGKVTKEVREILAMIREYDAVLGTGHLDAQESLVLIEEAKNMGVNRILVDHPEYWVTHMSLEEQLRLVQDYDVCIGRYYAQPMPDGSFHVNLPENLEAYRKIGYKNMIISTDGGQLANPHWEDALRMYMQYFADQGVPEEHINYMAKELPANLLGLPTK